MFYGPRRRDKARRPRRAVAFAVRRAPTANAAARQTSAGRSRASPAPPRLQGKTYCTCTVQQRCVRVVEASGKMNYGDWNYATDSLFYPIGRVCCTVTTFTTFQKHFLPPSEARGIIYTVILEWSTRLVHMLNQKGTCARGWKREARRSVEKRGERAQVRLWFNEFRAPIHMKKNARSRRDLESISESRAAPLLLCPVEPGKSRTPSPTCTSGHIARSLFVQLSEAERSVADAELRPAPRCSPSYGLCGATPCSAVRRLRAARFCVRRGYESMPEHSSVSKGQCQPQRFVGPKKWRAAVG